MSKRLVVFLCLCLLCNISAKAQQTAKFASDYWPGFTNIDGSGLYWDIIRKVYQQNNIEVSFETTNYTRSVELTRNNLVQAYVGAYIDEADFVLYPHYHIDVDYIAACAAADYPGNIDKASLVNASVAWIKGYGFEDVFDVPSAFRELPDRATGLRMVAKHRIDFYLDADSDIRIYLKDKPALAAKIKCAVIHQKKIYIAFADTPFGRRLMQLWDSTIPVLIKSGYIQQIYQHYGLKPFPYAKTEHKPQ